MAVASTGRSIEKGNDFCQRESIARSVVESDCSYATRSPVRSSTCKLGNTNASA